MKRHSISIPVLLALALLHLPREAEAQRPRSIQRLNEPAKRALVIGNDLYSRIPLANAVNDAQAISEQLKELGFEVKAHFDVDQRSFDRAVDEFIFDLGSGDTGVFFYAGHGVQIEGLNYLIPVDFEASDAVEVKYRAYPADLLRERMEGAGTARNILILDACRDNPFRGTRSFGGGLAHMKAGIGTFVAFSTAPGQTAEDNPSGSYSLFTQHLIDALGVPGLSLDEIFNEVRQRVFRDSKGRQVPWTSSSIIGEFHFRPLPEVIQPSRGGLALEVNVDGAVVLLDDQRTEVRRRPTGELYLSGVPAGAHVVTVRKEGYSDEQRFIEIRGGKTSRLPPIVLTPIDLASSPPSLRNPPIFTRNSTDSFCEALEEILQACPGDFQGLVDPAALAEARTFLVPAVALPDAWYSQVFRADTGRHRYLASFGIARAADAEIKMTWYATKVERCLAPEVLGDQRRGTRSHHIEVAAQSKRCQIEIAVNGQDVDITISGLQR